jgi:hypothetical protein
VPFPFPASAKAAGLLSNFFLPALGRQRLQHSLSIRTLWNEMCSSFFLLAAVLAALMLTVRAANDWNVPCHQGRCSYEIAGTANNAAVSVHIVRHITPVYFSTQLDLRSMPVQWGHEHLISDFTEAGGYAMVHCDPEAEEHDIHIVCQDTDTISAGCDHVHQGSAIGTVVRLPDNVCRNSFPNHHLD